MGKGRQQFSNQKGGQRKSSLSSFKKALDKISGGDPAGLLSAYFATPMGKKIQPKVMEALEKSPLCKVVEGIREQHCKAPNKQKAQWLSLVAPHLENKWLQAKGFEFCNQQFANARLYAEKYGAGTPYSLIPKILPPSKQPIPDSTKKQVKLF